MYDYANQHISLEIINFFQETSRSWNFIQAAGKST